MKDNTPLSPLSTTDTLSVDDILSSAEPLSKMDSINSHDKIDTLSADDATETLPTTDTLNTMNSVNLHDKIDNRSTDDTLSTAETLTTNRTLSTPDRSDSTHGDETDNSQDQNPEKSSEEILPTTEYDDSHDDTPEIHDMRPEEQEMASPETPPQAPDYAAFARVPVGFDLMTIIYHLSEGEDLLTESLNFWLMDEQLHIEISLFDFPMIRISFNATTLNDRYGYLPLSLSKYSSNFQLIEFEMQRHVLTTFSMSRCTLSRLELFKTLRMKHSPIDYSKSISMLNVRGAYLKHLKHHSEGSSTFSLKNGRHELIFYDKHLELKDKVKGKKEILDALPDKMMRIEWKFKKPDLILSRLKIKGCLDLIDSYPSIVDRYTEHCGKILPEIPAPPDLQIDFPSSDLMDVCEAMKAKYGKQSLRFATEAMLAYCLVNKDGLESFYDTPKFGREQSKAFNDRIKRWVPLVASIGPVKCIDLYNESRDGLLSSAEIFDT